MAEEHYLDQIKKSVTFVFLRKHNEVTALGTGFFVGIGIDNNSKYVTYFVTAKHVLQSENGNLYSEIYLRLNTQNEVPLVKFTYEPSSILTHPDSNVDIVCIPLTVDRNEFDVLYIPNSYFASREIINEKGIKEGDEIFYCGLFNPYIGEQRSQPLTRFGKVSSLTDEKIRISKENEPVKLAHLYLFESHATAGFSGSPVFFKLDRLRQANQIHYGNPEVYLAGIMIGHYNDLIVNPIIDLNKKKDIILRDLNLGISAVTPCYLLSEILFSSSEIKAREDVKSNAANLNRQNFIKNIRLSS